MARRRDAATPALRVVEQAGVEHAVHAYPHDPAVASYGEEAASALGVAARRVLKTLCVEADGELCVAVVPVADRLDLKAVATALGAKRARMADPERAQRVTGYVVGGIAPLGQRRRLRTVVERRALEEATVFVSAGRRGLEIELPPAALVELTDATTAALTRS